MKTQIYWTKTYDGEKWNVRIIKPFDVIFFDVICEDDSYIKSFQNEFDADLFVKEICKPIYFESFGTNYELIELGERDSKWIEILKVIEEFDNGLKAWGEYLMLPWHKKVLRWIILHTPAKHLFIN